MILQDMHLHSNYSDGLNSLEEMVLKAIELGIKEISFTDHIRETSTWYELYLIEIKHLQNKYYKDIKIYPGFEAKVVDHNGNLDIPSNLIMRDRISIVSAIHRIPIGNGSFITKHDIPNITELSFDNLIKSVEGLTFNNYTNRLAHPNSLLNYFSIQKREKYWNTIEKLLDSSKINLELNAKYHSPPIPSKIIKKYKNRIIIGSDSHSLYDLELRIKTLLKYHTLL